jgi:hypothetical protein
MRAMRATVANVSVIRRGETLLRAQADRTALPPQ